MAWIGTKVFDPRRFDCGYCGHIVASKEGYSREYETGPMHNRIKVTEYIYICPSCEGPNYFWKDGRRTPGTLPGEAVQSLPADLQKLYGEARSCCSVNAFTASVLASRKLLMNIAVSKGAKEGLKFIEYVDYLEDNHFAPPESHDWVDHIRKKGNEATHEIALMNKDDAEELVSFCEMLLKFIYEFPNRMAKKKKG
jgi:hypothetical protein